MFTTTITKKEYTKIKEAKKALDKMLTFALSKNKKFKDNAFGSFKKSFGSKSSTSYLTNLRKSWRQTNTL